MSTCRFPELFDRGTSSPGNRQSDLGKSPPIQEEVVGLAIRDVIRSQRIEIRTGLHAGEWELFVAGQVRAVNASLSRFPPFHLDKEKVEASGAVDRGVSCEDTASIRRSPDCVTQALTRVCEKNVLVPVEVTFRICLD